MSALLSLLLSLGQQESPTVRDLFEKLDDDSVELRDEAAHRLVRLGPLIIPEIQSRMKSASLETRERLSEVLRDIQKAQRLAEVLPSPHLVSLNARGMTVDQALVFFHKEGSKPFLADGDPSKEKVTLALDRTPFWEALDALCRASGTRTLGFRGESILLKNEPYAAFPRTVVGPLGAFLRRIETVSGSSFDGQDKFDQLSAQIEVCWEPGTRPYRILGQIREAKDDRGADFLAPGGESDPEAAHPAPDALHEALSLTLDRAPKAEAASLSRLKIEIQVEFVLKALELVLTDPEARGLRTASRAGFSAMLNRMSRAGDEVKLTITVMPGPEFKYAFDPHQIRLRDSDGRDYPGELLEAAQNQYGMGYSLGFPVKRKVAVKEISIRIPVEIHTESLVLLAKDVPLR